MNGTQTQPAKSGKPRSNKPAAPKVGQQLPVDNNDTKGTEAAMDPSTAHQGPVFCACGCGEEVKGKKSRFVPGHDARHFGRVKNFAEGKLTEAQAGPQAVSDAREGKFGHGSFAPRWNVLKGDVPPISATPAKERSKAQQLQAKVDSLRNQLAKAEKELAEAKEVDGDREEIVEAMKAEGTTN